MKEVRQALKSRQFIVTFLLLLLAAWAGSIFGVSYLGESIDYGSPAVTFYAGFLVALCMATLVIVLSSPAAVVPLVSLPRFLLADFPLFIVLAPYVRTLAPTFAAIGAAAAIAFAHGRWVA